MGCTSSNSASDEVVVEFPEESKKESRIPSLSIFSSGKEKEPVNNNPVEPAETAPVQDEDAFFKRETIVEINAKGAGGLNALSQPSIKLPVKPDVGKARPYSTRSKTFGPRPVMGWMYKEGHQVLNWKRRYFVLCKGLLIYYENSSDTAPYGVNEKGRFNLKDYDIKGPEECVGKGKLKNPNLLFKLKHNKDNGKDYYFEVENEDVRTMWSKAIRRHIDYSCAESLGFLEI